MVPYSPRRLPHSIFIRSCHHDERHLEARVGNVEAHKGGRQVFGAVARADTDIAALIQRSLEAVGRTADTAVTAFTDGCPGLQSILNKVGVTRRPIADWFHIAMRLQHATQAASGVSADNPSRVQAKAVIVEEVERLRWRIWNGKATNAKRSIDRVRKVMHVYREERGDRMGSAPSRRLWHALLDVDDYLRGQSSWLVNYAKRYRAGLRVGTSVTEGTANFLINRRLARVSANCFRHTPTRTSKPPRPHDSRNLWTLPGAPRSLMKICVACGCSRRNARSARSSSPLSGWLDSIPFLSRLTRSQPSNPTCVH
jgi:hypothetical protein